MSSLNKTPHYNLSQFGDSPDDKPSWRGDYTADMSRIDAQMYRNATDVTTATGIANDAKTTARSAQTEAQSAHTEIQSVRETAQSAQSTAQSAQKEIQSVRETAQSARTEVQEVRGTVDAQGSYFTALGIDSAVDAQNLASLIKTKGNVAANGIVTDGSKDVTNAINVFIQSSDVPGVYFPAGIYKISNSINLPKNTDHPYGFYADPGAVFVATASMSDMMVVGGVSKKGRWIENYTIKGGVFMCQGLAQNAIRFTSAIRGVKLSDVTVQDAVNAAILMENTAPVDTLMSNIRINYVDRSQSSKPVQSKYGIKVNGTDWQLSGLYASHCNKFVYSAGTLVVDNVHVFNEYGDPVSCGINIQSGFLQASNIYADTTDVAISAKKDDGTFSSSTKMYCTNVKHYFYREINRPVRTFEVHDNAYFMAGNVSTSYKEKTSPTYVFYYAKDNGSFSNNAYNAYTYAIEPNGIQNTFATVQENSHVSNMYTVASGHTHVAGDGVCIGWIPDAPVSGHCAVTFIPQSENNYNVSSTIAQFRIALPSSGGIPTNMHVTCFNINESDGSVKYINGIGCYANREYLHFGVKAAVADASGRKYYPLYLYNASKALGYVPDINFWIFGTNNSPHFAWHKWESGLSDSSFILHT